MNYTHTWEKVPVLYRDYVFTGMLYLLTLKAMIFCEQQPMIVRILVKQYSPSPYMLQYKAPSSGVSFYTF